MHIREDIYKACWMGLNVRGVSHCWFRWFTSVCACCSSCFSIVGFVSSCEFSQFLTRSALSSIAPLKDAKQCLLKAHHICRLLTRNANDTTPLLWVFNNGFFVSISIQISLNFLDVRLMANWPALKKKADRISSGSSSIWRI